MPGRLTLTRPMSEVAAWLSCEPIVEQPPRHNIAPGQEVVVKTGDGLTLARWGLIPVGRVNARGRPVMETLINARSETVFDKSAYKGVARAVIPADGWYEWTGQARRKTAWHITRRDKDLMGFAAIFDVWTAPGGQKVRQAATVTCAPNADVRDIHHRMGVILTADQIDTWISGTDDDAQRLMRPLPDGTLHIKEAKGVDWGMP